jgi:type IV pilus assembly protein PilZ
MSQGDDRRDQTRAAIELKVEYRRLNTFFYDYTKNISRGGTFIRTRRPLPVGSQFLFKLVVPTLESPLCLTGEVRWIQAASESAESGMGIRFVFADDQERVAVESVVEKLMVSSLGPLIYTRLRDLP